VLVPFDERSADCGEVDCIASALLFSVPEGWLGGFFSSPIELLAVSGSIIVVVIPEKRNEPRLKSPFDLVDPNFGGLVSDLLLFNETGGFFLPMLPKNFR
jgi:hypothetical protein